MDVGQFAVNIDLNQHPFKGRREDFVTSLKGLFFDTAHYNDFIAISEASSIGVLRDVFNNTSHSILYDRMSSSEYLVLAYNHEKWRLEDVYEVSAVGRYLGGKFVNNEDPEVSIYNIATHQPNWKNKAGALAAFNDYIQEIETKHPEVPIIAAGDWNRKPDNLRVNIGLQTVFNGEPTTKAGNPIDNVLYRGNIRIEDSCVRNDYTLYSHLPVEALLTYYL